MEKIIPSQSRSFKSDRSNVAVAYIRVSTKTQEEKGFSIEIQREKAIEYAKNNGFVLNEDMIFEEAKPASKSYSDDFEDAYNLTEKLKSRPELNKIISLAGEKKFCHLIVYTRDRLTRNIDDCLALRTYFKKVGVLVHYSRPGEFSKIEDSKINNFLELILASVAELEANTIGIRVKGGNRSCIKNSYWPGGRVPFGYSPVDAPDSKKNSTIKSEAFEKAMVQEIFNLYTQCGYGYRRISDEMNKKFPFIKWSKSKVESIIKNETYTGYIAWDRRGGRRNPGSHKEYDKSPFIEDASIISKQQWINTVELRKKKQELKDSKYYNTNFLLRGKLVCGKCGSTMETKNYGKGKKSVYRCPNSNEHGISELIVEKELVEQQFHSELSDLFLYKNMDNIWALYKAKLENRKKEDTRLIESIKNKLAEISLLKRKLNSIISLHLDEKIKVRMYEQSIILNKQEQSYKGQLDFIENKNYQYFETKDEFFNAIMRVFEYYGNFQREEKRMLIDIIVDTIMVNTISPNQSELKLTLMLSPPKEL